MGYILGENKRCFYESEILWGTIRGAFNKNGIFCGEPSGRYV